MRTHALHRMVALVTVSLTFGLVASGCGRNEEHLTAPLTPAASLSSSSVPGTYMWEISWNGSGISCGATWYWQLSDSSWVLGGQASGCGAQASPVSGAGTVPTSAIAVKALGGVSASYECGAYDSVTKALNNQQGVSIDFGAQVPSSYVTYQPWTGNKVRTKCPSGGSFSFSLHS